jgi:hypothetical protein
VLIDQEEKLGNVQVKVLTKWVNKESPLVNDSVIATPIKIEKKRIVSFKDEEMFKSSKSPNIAKFEEGSSSQVCNIFFYKFHEYIY